MLEIYLVASCLPLIELKGPLPDFSYMPPLRFRSIWKIGHLRWDEQCPCREQPGPHAFATGIFFFLTKDGLGNKESEFMSDVVDA